MELMVAVNALTESIPQIESGQEEFEEDSMPPPPNEFSLDPEVLAEIMGSSAAPPQAPAAPQPPQPQKVDPAVAALTKIAASTVASKDSLMARIQMLRVSLHFKLLLLHTCL